MGQAVRMLLFRITSAPFRRRIEERLKMAGIVTKMRTVVCVVASADSAVLSANKIRSFLFPCSAIYCGTIK